MQNEYLLAQQRQSAACLLTGRGVPAHVIYHTVQRQLAAACNPALGLPTPAVPSSCPSETKRLVFKGRQGSGFIEGFFVTYGAVLVELLSLQPTSGNLPQQCDHLKPLQGTSVQTPSRYRVQRVKSALCAPSEGQGKERIASCLLCIEAKSYKHWVTQGRLGEATFPQRNCYLQLLIM